MKVLIVCFSKMAYIPYMKLHIDILRGLGAEIHLAYWNRDGKPDMAPPENIALHEFKMLQKDEQNKIAKIARFIGYRRFVREILGKSSFDRIVLLSTQPALLLADILLAEYRNRYVYDFRDMTYEKIGLYKYCVGTLVKNSLATVVSSDAFRRYLPDNRNIFTSHNVTPAALEFREIRSSKPRSRKPIRIRHWGLIRHKDTNRLVISGIANDSRFELHYHGRIEKTTLLLQQFCIANGIRNVFFHGTYLPCDRYGFIEATDILHNMYDNDFQMRPAVSNKFYDGVVHYIPQICSKGSHMGRMAGEYGVGLQIDPGSPSFADDIYFYYTDLDWDVFRSNADRFLNAALDEYGLCCKAVADAVGAV